MKKFCLASISFISFSFVSWSYGSELLVPSLQDESWVKGPKPQLKKEHFPSPSSHEKEIPDIPEEIILTEPVILVDEHGDFYESYSPEDALPDAPLIEPEIRQAFEKENTTPQLNEEDNSFLQTDIFFSIRFDYTQPQLSDENKRIANQIVEIMKKNDNQRLEIVTAEETSGPAKLKASQFIRYLKEGGLNANRMAVNLTQNDQATLLQDHTILAIIKQFPEN